MSEALAAPLLGDPHPAAKKVRELEQDGADWYECRDLNPGSGVGNAR